MNLDGDGDCGGEMVRVNGAGHGNDGIVTKKAILFLPGPTQDSRDRARDRYKPRYHLVP